MALVRRRKSLRILNFSKSKRSEEELSPDLLCIIPVIVFLGLKRSTISCHVLDVHLVFYGQLLWPYVRGSRGGACELGLKVEMCVSSRFLQVVSAKVQTQ